MFSKEFDEIVNFRRSNRKFDPNIEVPNDVIQKSIERAVLSPNSSNMQLWARVEGAPAPARNHLRPARRPA